MKKLYLKPTKALDFDELKDRIGPNKQLSFSSNTSIPAKKTTKAGSFMPLYLLILVALVQGITEFLPVSSSGHLILISELSIAQDQGQTIDVAVHIGTLFAVVLYFWRDVSLGLSGIPRLLTGHIDTAGSKLAFLLLIATIPAILFGLFIKLTGLNDAMRSMTVIGWTMLLFGLLLWWADQRGNVEKTQADWNLNDAVKMGLWQAVALIPGTSRSGICITAGRMLGYSRHDSAKLAMLMSIPTIIASGVLLGAEVIAKADAQVAHDGAFAATFAFVAALFALSIMMRLLRTVSYTPYVIYRVALGVVLLGLAYS